MSETVKGVIIQLDAATEVQPKGSSLRALLHQTARMIEYLDQQMRPKVDAKGMVHFLVTSGVAADSGQPFVGVQYAGQVSQMSPEAARGLAMNILQAAEASEMDAAVLRFATRELDLTPKKAAALLATFRVARDARRGKDATSA